VATLGSFDSGSGKGLSFAISVPGAQGFALALSRFGKGLDDFSDFWNGKFKVWWYALRQLDYASAGTSTGDRWARCPTAIGSGRTSTTPPPRSWCCAAR
jgi:hypothetical protein